MAEEFPNNEGLRTYGTLPAMTLDEVKARAQRIKDNRGYPPLSIHLQGPVILTEDENALINDFLTYWRDFLK